MFCASEQSLEPYPEKQAHCPVTRSQRPRPEHSWDMKHDGHSGLRKRVDVGKQQSRDATQGVLRRGGTTHHTPEPRAGLHRWAL
jgi:hypothetical protein